MDNKNRKFTYVLFGLFALFLILLSANKLSGEDDYFWHLNTGRYIIDNGFPDTDVFNWVQPENEWYASSWLWDVLTYGLYSLFGYGSLSILTVILYLLIFYMLFKTASMFDVNYNVLLILFILLCFGIFERLTPRPHIITYLFSVILLYIICSYKYKDLRNEKVLYLIPVMILIWVNMHSGFLLGLAILLIFVADVIISKVRKNRTYPFTLGKLLLITLISLLVIFINPYGFGYISYVITGFEANAVYKVGEWISPFSNTINDRFYITIYYILLIAGIAALYYGIKKKDFFVFALTLVLMINSARAIRYTVDYEIVSFVFIAAAINYLLSVIEIKSVKNYLFESRDIKIVTGVLLAAIIFSILNGNLYKGLLNYDRTTGLGIDESYYPVKASELINENGLNDKHKKVFNTFESGGFLTWSTGMKNFIDSRLSNHFIVNEYDTLFNKILFYAPKAEEYDFDMIYYFDPFIPILPAVMEKHLLYHFVSFPDKYKLVYWDDRMQLFIKNIPEAADVVSKYEYKYVTPYNYIYQKATLYAGYTSDNARFMQEIQRKQNEDPESVYLQAIITDYVK